MLYITGDTHGEVSRFAWFQRTVRPQPQDSLIVAGDFGCVFGNDAQDERKLDALAKLPFTILFIDGNHECFPKLFAYPEEQRCGGRIHRIRPNVIHLMRGQVFTLEGMKIFTMGGGYSVDRASRCPGISWWPEEMPSEDEYAEAASNLERNGSAVDFIISHAAPDETMEMLRQRGLVSSRCMEEMRLNFFLENVRRTVGHRHYYFGHMHMDRELWRNQTALFYDVYCLNTGNKVCEEQP